MKGEGSMREKILSVIQKTVVLFLAFLMLVTMMPVGLFPGNDTPSAEGRFIRNLPSAEVYAQWANNDEAIRNIGRYNSVYYKFDISELTKVKEEEVKEVTLRLAFLKGSGMINNAVRISFIDADKMPSKAEGVSLLPLAENRYESIYPNTLGNEDVLAEINIFDYAMNEVKQGKTEIGVGISANMPICVAMASQNYLDASYRPCIKMVTGIAEDSDSDTLAKTHLKEMAFVSKNNGDKTGDKLSENAGGLLIGNGCEMYLKFDIDRADIIGELYSARLVLRNSNKNDDVKAKVYLLNNSEWTADEISYNNKPRGEETEVMTVIENNSDTITIDATQQVCEAVKQGMDTLTFRIVGVDDRINRFENGRFVPQLYLKASDDKDIVCVSETALNALGNNRSSFVTMNLLNEYSSQNGGNAKIVWNELDANNEVLKDKIYIGENGDITRPKWYENGVHIVANAEIRSNDYITNRRYYLTIPAESAPDYSKYKFSNYMDIGGAQSEKEQKAEYKNVGSGRKRWIEGHIFSYRVPQKGAIMMLNFACSPYETNYLTLKLWAEDTASPNELKIIPYDYMGEEKVYSIPNEAKSGSDGFMYVTYALPKEYTRGKDSVSLRISFDKFTEEPSRAVYAAYMTQNSFFEPKQFEKQGEKTVSETSFADEAISKFIKNFRLLFGGEDRAETETETGESEIAMVDEEDNSIIFSGKDVNIAFKINMEERVASVYQKTEYFDRYCDGCPISENDGVVSIEFGPYILLWNRREDELKIEDIDRELAGIYKEMPSNVYYNFSEEWQLTDDSAVPSGNVIADGNTLSIASKSAIMLNHISDPMNNSDWRVSTINGKSVSEISFTSTEKIEEVTVKAVGGIPENVEKLTVLLMMYDDGKIVYAKKAETDLYEGIYNYSFNLSEEHLYMRKGRTLKVLVYDNTENMSEILPKIELPQTNK